MTIEDSLNIDTSGFERFFPKEPPVSSTVQQALIPDRSVFIRCPLPNIPGSVVNPDSLRALYQGGAFPQNRAFNPAVAQSPSGSASTLVFSATTASSSSSSSSASTNNPPAEQTAFIATPPMNPGDVFRGTILLAKSFHGIQIAVNNPARVRLYATANDQNADLSRIATDAPGLGNEQGIVFDVSLDTTPVAWQFPVSTDGSNGDSPRTNIFYITVDNIGSGSNVINISITYIPMQS
jgi:hypothetical protein